MVNIFWVKKYIIRSILIAVAITLILSFIAHDIIPHSHPSVIFGTGIQAIFHGNDRKWWYLALLVASLVAVNLIKKLRFNIKLEEIISRNSLCLRGYILKSFNPIRQALRKGILNPKLCD